MSGRADGELASPYAALELPADVDMPDARLRFAAAVLALPCSIVLLFADGFLIRGFGVLGLVACAFWFRSARAARRDVTTAPRRTLVLAEWHVALREDGADDRAISWPDVEGVEVDEARDAIVVTGATGEELVIRPGYGGLGLEDLHTRIIRARTESVSGTDHGARTRDRG